MKKRLLDFGKISGYSFISAIVAVSIVLAAVYHLSADRFLYNTFVGGIDISGLTYEEAESLLFANVNNYHDESVEVTINDEVNRLSIKDLDPLFDHSSILNRVYNNQHPEEAFIKTLFANTYRQIEYTDVALPVQVERKTLNNWVQENYDTIDTVAEPTIELRDGKFVVLEGRVGDELDPQSLISLKLHLGQLSTEDLNLSTSKTFPNIIDKEVEAVAKKANQSLTQNIVLTAGDVRVEEGLRPEWFNFDVTDDTTKYALYNKEFKYQTFGTGVVAGESTQASFTMILDKAEIIDFIETKVIDKLNGSVENITLSLDENGEIIVDGFLHDGLTLKTDEAVELIVNNFRKGVFENDLPLAISQGEIIDETGLDLGITEEIAKGESHFEGSDWARINNVTVGLSKFQNIIIAPGEEFDYGDYVGPIDATGGFVPGWVIKNRTQLVKEYGGGICQTSTTIFRAALEAGFPITERHQHSYDVSYYRWPYVGIDASVYLPYASMKFLNDSDDHILIQQYVDTDNLIAYVWIYGTSDGRTVEMSEPQAWGKYWASNVVEIPTAGLAPGTRILNHGAVPGLKTSVTRTVTYADGKVDTYDINSSYVAVPATYLVAEETSEG